MTLFTQILAFFREFQFWIVVAPWELALRVRLGKSATTLKPGPHFRIPFVDRIFVQSSRLRTICDNGQTMGTKDGRNLTVSVSISYSIEDIAKLYSTVSIPELTLLIQVEGLIAQVISTTQSELLTPKFIEEAVSPSMPAAEWGLGNVRLNVISFAYVKVYRLMQHEYRSLSNNNDLDAAAHRP